MVFPGKRDALTSIWEIIPNNNKNIDGDTDNDNDLKTNHEINEILCAP